MRRYYRSVIREASGFADDLENLDTLHRDRSAGWRPLLGEGCGRTCVFFGVEVHDATTSHVGCDS